MRLFVAVNFNDTTRGQLTTLIDGLRPHSSRGRFTIPDNLHLTLAFLGECDAKQASAIKTAMGKIDFEAFPIKIERVGRFKRNGGDIWWAGVQDSKALSSLYEDLKDKLLHVGFALDERKYSPHITLGREIETDVLPWRLAPFGETVESIELMKSERINGKLTYTPIYSKPAL